VTDRASTDKGRQERGDLNAFLRDFGLNPAVSVPAQDPPDFVLEIDGRRIGLEHTRYFRDDAELAADAEWRRFNGLLLAERRKGPPELLHILVTVFLSAPLPEKSLRPQLAAELVETVRVALPLRRGEERVVYDLSRYPLLCAHAQELLLIEGRPAMIIDWNADQTSFLWPVLMEVVEEAIAKKTEKIKRATESVNEFWLLVTANASALSATAPDTMAADLAATESTCRASGFARIYFHDALTNTVLEWSSGAGWRAVSRSGG
jgi:hypothetical protein